MVARRQLHVHVGSYAREPCDPRVTPCASLINIIKLTIWSTIPEQETDGELSASDHRHITMNTLPTIQRQANVETVILIIVPARPLPRTHIMAQYYIAI